MAEFTRFNTGNEKSIDDPMEYNALRRQHNIMCLIGNGFDTAILNQPEFKDFVGQKGKTTSYYDFYLFLKSSEYGDKLKEDDNIIYAKMCADIKSTTDKAEKQKWANFEKIVENLIFNKNDANIKKFLKPYNLPTNEKKYIRKIAEDLEQLGNLFSTYLNELLPVKLLVEINKKAKENQWASISLSEFLGDLCKDDYNKLYFREEFTDFDEDSEYQLITDTDKQNKYRTKKRKKENNIYNNDLFNYMIFNFNYSTLLDNYIYLDKNQFKPHRSRYSEIDRNFGFRIDPKGFIKRHYKLTNKEIPDEEINFSSYLLTDIIHPHGIKDIPRSFLFGTERKIDDITDPKNQFIKSFWGQNEKKYGRCFDETELFIIYGMSLERCDGWWYDKIFEQLLKNTPKGTPKAELIIYKYIDIDIDQTKMSDEEYNNRIEDFKNDIKKMFIKGRTSYTKRSKFTTKENTVMKRIYVVPFKKNDTRFLGFNSKKQTVDEGKEK